ncbi:type IV secretion system protein [Azospirillum rugosum]|uniref:Type IV secretion system protein TrbL n=1 Tax=Azospirillum rugosum TaxID=416170 RepID=A0ABS4SKE0_9PROT|nr:type IV secretion system protein [Azospirillum rugosum]MBP2292947.1 type IV secretion system protein TrbL [Azospirillum rugosum]MDQ0526496.1 type IV secretion system protein TrbL [Azospirillum rugosum]
MDVSALSVALHQLTAAVVTGLGLLGPDVRAALRMLMMLSYTLALLLWLFEGKAAVHGPFLRMLLKFAAIGALVEWFPAGSAALMQAAARQGLSLVPGGGFSLDDPGYIAHLGIQAVIPLMLRVKEMLGPIDFFLNFVEIVLFLLAALVVIVSFCILAIQVFLAFLEYRLLSLAAYLAIPFAVLGPTSFVAERAIGYIAATALKLLVLGCIIAMCGTTLLALTFTGTPTLAQAFGVAVLSAAIFVLAIKAPRAAAGLVNGGPVMDGVTALAALWTAGWLGARTVAGAAAATSGAPGSLAVGASAVWGGLRYATAGALSAVGSGAGDDGAAANAAAGRRYPAGRFGGSRASAPRDSGWDQPMSAAQRSELDRLAAGRPYDPDMTRGQASRLIEQWGGDRSWYAGPQADRPADPPGNTDGRPANRPKRNEGEA